MDNKNIFSENLKEYMRINGKSRNEVCDALGISYYTFSDWVNGKKYPRMDKVEMLADYFGILKSDLIEEKCIDKKNSTDKMVLTDGEKKILELFRRIPEDKQDMAIEMIRAALNSQK